MNKFLYIAALLLVYVSAYAQKEKSSWEKEKERLKYEKTDKYKGPEDWHGSYPTDMQDQDIYSGGSGTTVPGGSGGGIQYSPQQIQRDREKRYNGMERGGGSGTLPYDPEVKRPDPLEIPDLDAPDVDLPTPDIDLDPPAIPPLVWKVLLFIVIFIALVYIAYLIVRNRRPSNAKVIVDVENDWNPEMITKTELELRLEEAMAKEDYRECIRIYFTFILKELISKGYIRWSKDKTNHDYLLELSGRQEFTGFMKAVRVYDLVWYGEYNIDEEIYELLRPELETYYRSLEPKNER